MTLSMIVAGLVLGGQDGPPAPGLVGERWLNSDAPVSLTARKGKVTIVHFWTFGCINCKRNLGAYNSWADKFKKDGVLVVGIHTPELAIEKDENQLKAAISKQKITYPVLIDKDRTNWDAWNQRYWPTVYVIDKKGRIRFNWEGELEWEGAGGTAKVEKVVKSLLLEKS